MNHRRHEPSYSKGVASHPDCLEVPPKSLGTRLPKGAELTGKFS